ncbi:UvrD-helicase domain-containing protein [Pseudoalteromonas sp. B193]
MQALNPLTMPLIGQSLIEASAGTGKTYTITGLYLRYLLGMQIEGELNTPLSVEQNFGSNLYRRCHSRN